MKTVFSIATAIALLVTVHSGAWCQTVKTAAKVQKKVAVGLTDQQRAAIADETVALLTGKVWTIYWSLQGAKKPVVLNDELTFAGNGVTSKYLKSKGFDGSQYSLRVHDDKVAVWETVQQNFETGDMAMMRGEIRNGDLLGTITLRTKAGLMEIYSYGTSVPPSLPVQEEVTAKTTVMQKETKEQKETK